MVFCLILLSTTSYSQEKILNIQIWSARTKYPQIIQEVPSKHLLIADSIVYAISRFRKKVINDADSILFFVQDRLVFDSIYQKNNRPCSLYEKSIFVRFNVIEGHVTSSYTYLFSYPIKCKEEDDEFFIKLLYKQIGQLNYR